MKKGKKPSFKSNLIFSYKDKKYFRGGAFSQWTFWLTIPFLLSYVPNSIKKKTH